MSVSEQQSAADVPGDRKSAAGELTCGNCGTRARAGARVCAECAHGLYRTCYCGWELPASERTCPNCGADWSQSMRVARRSRSHKPRKAEAIRYALFGVAWAVGGTVVLYLLATLFALAAPAAATGLPLGLVDRLVLAGQGIAYLVVSAATGLARNLAVISGGLLVVAIGALGGLAAYLLRVRRGRSGRWGMRRVQRKRRR